MAEVNGSGASPVTYEQLAELEQEFDEVDVEVLRHQYRLSNELYSRRQKLVSQIPGFWPLVLESSPQDIDRYIQPSDSEIFAKCLTGISVARFELDSSPEKGDPRSVSITFTFSENDWFNDGTLRKQFWWRQARDGWTGLVSEPVRVHWKKGRDPTRGLMDGACKLWEARKAAGDMAKRDLAEFDRMAKLTETWNGDNTSFFTWFAFVSGRRWVSEEESQAAVAESRRRRQGKDGTAKGVAEGTDVEDDQQLEAQVEAHEDGDGLATVITEDLWPGAIKYFTQAQEDEGASDGSFESGDEDDKGEADNESADEQVRDLRSLVRRGSDTAPVVDQARKRRKVGK